MYRVNLYGEEGRTIEIYIPFSEPLVKEIQGQKIETVGIRFGIRCENPDIIVRKAVTNAAIAAIEEVLWGLIGSNDYCKVGGFIDMLYSYVRIATNREVSYLYPISRDGGNVAMHVFNVEVKCSELAKNLYDGINKAREENERIHPLG